MSIRGTHGRGTRGRGRGLRGARAGSSFSGNLPNLDTSETLPEIGSHDHVAGDDALSKAMLRILERVVGPNTRAEAAGQLRNDSGLTELSFSGVLLEFPLVW